MPLSVPPTPTKVLVIDDEIIDVPDVAKGRPTLVVVRAGRLCRVVVILELTPVSEIDRSGSVWRQLDTLFAHYVQLAAHGLSH